MKLNLIEFLFRAIAPNAASLSPGSMAVCAAERDDADGVAKSIPIIVLKGDADARLCPTEPGVLVGVVETPECPLIMFGLRLDKQTCGFPPDFSTTMPMHSAEQRSLLRILANADECMYVALSGAMPTLALGVKIRPSLHELFVTAWESVATLPLNPQADVDKATDLAEAAIERVARDAMRGFFSSGGPDPSSPGGGSANMPPPP